MDSFFLCEFQFCCCLARMFPTTYTKEQGGRIIRQANKLNTAYRIVSRRTAVMDSCASDVELMLFVCWDTEEVESVSEQLYYNPTVNVMCVIWRKVSSEMVKSFRKSVKSSMNISIY